MIQSLDVISVNLWQILISFINLILLFLIIKKFLFKPVKKVLAARQNELDEQYAEAKRAEEEANANRIAWKQKKEDLANEADAILQSATDSAKYRGEKIVAEAKDRADSILRQAEVEAALEKKKATADIKREIVEVSGALTEKMLGREINTADHQELIDSFIEEIGDEDDTDR
jgi:F-type H+-transporting ATPase subunit b